MSEEEAQLAKDTSKMSIAREFSTDPAFQKFGEWIIANGGFIQESLVFTSPGRYSFYN